MRIRLIKSHTEEEAIQKEQEILRALLLLKNERLLYELRKSYEQLKLLEDRLYGLFSKRDYLWSKAYQDILRSHLPFFWRSRYNEWEYIEVVKRLSCEGAILASILGAAS